MAFLSGFATYAVQFVIFGAVALAGIFLGKSLKEKKNASK